MPYTNTQKQIIMKTYTFTTLDSLRQEIETYYYEAYTLNDAKKYAKMIVANSRSNEMSHTRIKLSNK